MNPDAKLTKRESEIVELFAWGASKKDIANRLFISEHTVENHARNIFEKTGCTKVNELSAWYFCTRFQISFDLSPFKRNVLGIFLMILMLPQVVDNTMVAIRARTNSGTIRTVRVRTRREDNEEHATFIF